MALSKDTRNLTSGRLNRKACVKDFEECRKPLNHASQISLADVGDFLSDPNLRDDEEFLELIHVRWSLTAEIETVDSQGFCQFGTGFIERVDEVVDKFCPDLISQICNMSGNSTEMRWYSMSVSTALYVVEDAETGETLGDDCKVLLDYDEDDFSENCKILQSFKRHSEDEEGAWCLIDCYTHDSNLFEKYQRLTARHAQLGQRMKEKYGHLPEDGLPVIMISHPHGLAKRVSIGKVVDKEVSDVKDGKEICNYTYDAATCPGSGGSSVYILGRWHNGFGLSYDHPLCHLGTFNDDNIGVSSDGVIST